VPGSWAQVKATNVSTTTRTWAASDFTGLGNGLPTNLSGVQVNVNNQPAGWRELRGCGLPGWQDRRRPVEWPGVPLLRPRRYCATLRHRLSSIAGGDAGLHDLTERRGSDDWQRHDSGGRRRACGGGRISNQLHRLYPISISINGVSSPANINSAPPGPVVIPIQP
jgi:hypothetical protein